MAELGLSSAIVYSMYKPVAENDTDRICALLGLYRKAYVYIGTFIGTVGVAVSFFLRYLIKDFSSYDVNIYAVYFIFLFNTVISYFLFAYKSCLFVAHQKAGITSNILTVVLLLQYSSQIILLVLIKNYYLYIGLTPVFTIIYNLLIAYWAKKRYPYLICKGKIDSSQTKEIFINIKGLLVQRVSSISRNAFDSIFISSMLGLGVVAIYGNYYLIMNSVHSLVTVIITAAVASVGNSIVLEKKEKNYSDFRNINFLYLWLGGWFSICLLCLYQPFMLRWVGNELLFENPIMFLFCLQFFLNCIGDVVSLYIQSLGLWSKVQYVYLINAITNIILNYFGAKYAGVFGVLMATIISGVCFGPFISCKIIHKTYFKEISYGKYCVDVLKFSLVTLINAFVCYKLASILCGNGIGIWIIRIIICVLVPNFIYWIVFRKSSGFAFLIAKTKVVLRKR